MKKNRDACEVISWVVSLDEIWSKVILSSVEDTKDTTGDVGDVWNFGPD